MKKKRHRHKDNTPKEKIYINGRKKTIIKPLDDIKGNIPKQYFSKYIKKKEKCENPCLRCINNQDGYCNKFKSWCNMCSYKCITNGEKIYKYKYRDKNHKLHIID